MNRAGSADHGCLVAYRLSIIIYPGTEFGDPGDVASAGTGTMSDDAGGPAVEEAPKPKGCAGFPLPPLAPYSSAHSSLRPLSRSLSFYASLSLSLSLAFSPSLPLSLELVRYDGPRTVLTLTPLRARAVTLIPRSPRLRTRRVKSTRFSRPLSITRLPAGPTQRFGCLRQTNHTRVPLSSLCRVGRLGLPTHPSIPV